MSAQEPVNVFPEAPVGEPVAAGSRRKAVLPNAVVGVLAIAAIVSVGWIGIDRWSVAHADIPIQSANVLMDSTTQRSTVRGKIVRVLVAPGDTIEQGRLIAMLDDSALQTDIKRDQSALNEAQKEAAATQAAVLPPPIIGTLPAAAPTTPKRDLSLPKPADLAAIAKAQAVAAANVARKAHVASQIRELEVESQHSSDNLKAAQADLAAATEKAQAEKSPLEGLQSNLDLAKAQRDKFQDLYNQGIVSRVELQNKQADVDAAQTAFDQAQKQISDADAEVKQRQAEVDDVKKSLGTVDTKLKAAQQEFASIPVPAPPEVRLPPPSPLPLPGSLGPQNPRPLGPAMGLAPVRVAFAEPLHQAAQAKVAAAQAALSRDQNLLKSCQVLADTDGVVTAVRIEQGQLLAVGDPVIVVGLPKTTRIQAQVSHREAMRIHRGQRCEITIPGGGPSLPGVVDHFVTPGNDTVPASFEIGLLASVEPLRKLPPGTRVSVIVHPD